MSDCCTDIRTALIASATATLQALDPSALAVNACPPAAAPFAEFTYVIGTHPSLGGENLYVKFTPTAACLATAAHGMYAFGDGSAAPMNATAVGRVYAQYGVYSVTLVVSNSEGVMSAATHLVTLLAPSGPTTDAENTAVSSIDAAPVIGTPLDTTPGEWDGASSVAVQVQSSPDGSTWGDVSGATAYDWTPTDVVFGLFLRLKETAQPGGIVAYSDATAARAVEVPSQSLGSELVVNGSFATDSDWTKGTGWTIAGGKGVATSAANNAELAQAALTSSKFYQVESTITRSAGILRIRVGTNTLRSTTAASSTGRDIGGTNGTSLNFPSITTSSGTVDDVSAKEITINPVLTAPSANMRVDLFYTLPETPLDGEAIWFMPRVSDLAAGQYWLAAVYWTGAQWDVTLYRTNNHSKTPTTAAATNIGTSNGVRVNMNANSLTLYTTNDGGETWTQRGSTATDATYQSATGVTAVASTGFTPGQLVYAPAD